MVATARWLLPCRPASTRLLSMRSTLLVSCRAPYALGGDRAVVELAAVVGLSLLPGGRFDPLGSSTYGLGLVIADAIRRGATTIVLGLGGSASTDGGAGLAQALGARLLDAGGHDLPPGGGNLSRLAALIWRRFATRSAIPPSSSPASVDNPLLGPNGAAAVFGPQKVPDGMRSRRSSAACGTGPRRSLIRPDAATLNTQVPAPRVAPVTRRWLCSTQRSGRGIELILDLIDFDRRVIGADLVVTGEGSLDQQSLAGRRRSEWLVQRRLRAYGWSRSPAASS